MKKTHLQLKGQKIPFRHSDNGKQPALFCHGFAVDPYWYKTTISSLEEHYNIYAPIAYAIPTLSKQPRTIKGYAELTAEFREALALGNIPVIGHSLGGAVALQMSSYLQTQGATIAFNPVIKTDQSMLQFITKGFQKQKNELKGLEREINTRERSVKILPGFFKNIFSAPLESYLIVNDIAHIQYEGKTSEPTKIVVSDQDEFFHYTKQTKEDFKSHFSNLKWVPKKDRNHDWIAYEPTQAAQEVFSFLKS